METVKTFTPLATFTIAFCAVFTALGLMFNILLGPVKDNLARLEKNQVRLEENQTRLEKSQTRLEENQARLEKELKMEIEEFKSEVNTKLDQILQGVHNKL